MKACWRACSLLAAFLLTTFVSSQPNKPLIAFAGQSNVIGHNIEGASSDRAQYSGILEILGNDSLTEIEKEAALKAKFDEADEGTVYPDVSPFLARYILELDDRGLMNGIDDPLDYAKCSFVDPGRVGQFPAVPVSPYSRCGFSFGGELMFARSLYSTGAPWTSQDFELPKVAQGGTEIFNDWNINDGRLWRALNNTIHTTEGTWRALVWHQGENDCFVGADGIDTSFTYEGNLTALMTQAREEMHRATPFYASAADIPIAIVRIHWPNGPSARERFNRIVDAQRSFAENDSRATFVDTSELRGNYHLNAGGLFVVGDRIAQQLAPLLNDFPPPTPTLPTPAPAPTPTPPTPAPTPTPPLTNQEPIYINCGGPRFHDGNRVWGADQYFVGGSVFSTSAPISGTNIPLIYQSERWASRVVYQIPVQVGTYDVILHFAEIYVGAFGSGIRVFDVRIEGTLAFDDVDIYDATGAKNTAHIRTKFNVQVSDGVLTIELETGMQNPKISAIAVVPAGLAPFPSPVEVPTPPPIAPILLPTPPPVATPTPPITTQDPIFVDCGRAANEGNYFDGTNTWVPDTPFIDALYPTYSTTKTIADTASQDMYNTERYDLSGPSQMKYSISLLPGFYNIFLHFSEIYFGSPGSRVFGVKLEGKVEIESLDIVDVTGGLYRPHIESWFNFPVLDGSLEIEFLRIIENPKIQGIEIRPVASLPTPPPVVPTIPPIQPVAPTLPPIRPVAPTLPLIQPVAPSPPPIQPVAPTPPPIQPVAPTPPPIQPVAPTLPPIQPILPPIQPTLPPIQPVAPTSPPLPAPTPPPTTSYGISGFVLVDADTNLDVVGGFNCLPNPICVGNTQKFNIRAETFGTGIGSVLLTLSGRLTTTRVEGVSPYSLFGDKPGPVPDYIKKDLPAGDYTVTAQAFPLPQAQGIGSPIASLNFTIV